MERNQNLKAAMESWIKTVSAKLLATFTSHLAAGETPDWRKIPFMLPECEKVLLELSKDTRIAAHFNSLIESEAFFTPVKTTPDQTLENFLGYFVTNNQIVYDQAAFNKVYTLFENSFYDDHIKFRAIAPVPGLLVHILRQTQQNSPPIYDDDPEPLELAPDLIIRPLNDEEHRLVHNLEIVRRYSMHMGDFINAVSADYRFPKKLTPLAPGSSVIEPAFLSHQPSPLEQKMLEINRILGETIWILRLFKNGSISNSGSVHYGRNFFVGGGQHWFSSDLPQPFMQVPPYTLKRNELPQLGNLWQRFQAVKLDPARKNLVLALRRLNFSRTRSELEDKIIDLMIAAETLVKSPDVRDKSSAIVDYYAPHFPDNENEVALTMRKIYSMRSSIMHDGSLDEWKKIKSNRTINILQFILQAEEYTRLILMKEISARRVK